MKLINEFIFKDRKKAECFIEEAYHAGKIKGYLTYGDLCHTLFGDDINYNDYDIYENHGWIQIPILYIQELNHFDEKQYLVKLPEVNLIDRFVKELEEGRIKNEERINI